MSISTCQGVGGGHGPLVYRLRLTKNGISLFVKMGVVYVGLGVVCASVGDGV